MRESAHTENIKKARQNLPPMRMELAAQYIRDYTSARCVGSI